MRLIVILLVVGWGMSTSVVAATREPQPSSGCAAQTLAAGRRIERAITVDGGTRRFILDVPESLDARTPVPLLLDFHGFGHSAAGVWKVSGFRDLAEANHFITAYPDGATVQFTHRDRVYDGAGWEITAESTNRDLHFVVAMLDRLEAEYCIDRNRVFATGFSNGAYFSHLLGCVMSDRIAAIAPVSGGKRPAPCTPGRPVPALIFHGRQDDIIDVADGRAARDAWAQSNGCGAAKGAPCQSYAGCDAGADVEYCEGDFTHRWPPEATARIWEFLQRHPMGEEGSKGSRVQGSESEKPTDATKDPTFLAH